MVKSIPIILYSIWISAITGNSKKDPPLLKYFKRKYNQGLNRQGAT